MRCDHAGFLMKYSGSVPPRTTSSRSSPFSSPRDAGKLTSDIETTSSSDSPSSCWRRRWFQLQEDSTLRAFNEKQCVSSLPLQNACVRARSNVSMLEFEIISAHRIMILRAETQRDLHRWMAALGTFLYACDILQTQCLCKATGQHVVY